MLATGHGQPLMFISASATRVCNYYASTLHSFFVYHIYNFGAADVKYTVLVLPFNELANVRSSVNIISSSWLNVWYWSVIFFIFKYFLLLNKIKLYCQMRVSVTFIWILYRAVTVSFTSGAFLCYLEDQSRGRKYRSFPEPNYFVEHAQ